MGWTSDTWGPHVILWVLLPCPLLSLLRLPQPLLPLLLACEATVTAPPRHLCLRVRCSSTHAQPRPTATLHSKADCCSASMLTQLPASLLHVRAATVLCFLVRPPSSALCLLHTSAAPLHPRSGRRLSSSQQSHRPQLLRCAAASLCSVPARPGSGFIRYLCFGGTELTCIYTEYSLSGMNSTHWSPSQTSQKTGPTHSNLQSKHALT